MISGMGKDIANGALLIGGIAVTVVGAEAGLPVIAGIGALASLGAGLYQAISAPRSAPRDKHKVIAVGR